MTDDKLTRDDARALLSSHVEGSLDEGVSAQLDALLVSDAALAAEHRRLKDTLALLHGLPPPQAPADMVSKVRARLDAERHAQAAADKHQDDNVVRPTWRRHIGGMQGAVGLAAAAGIAVFFFVAAPGEQGASSAGDTAAAGIAGEDSAVAATIVAPDLPPALVAQAAAQAGMVEVRAGVYQGGRREAARFMLALKTAAAARGLEVSGFVPDAPQVRIEVSGR